MTCRREELELVAQHREVDVDERLAVDPAGELARLELGDGLREARRNAAKRLVDVRVAGHHRRQLELLLEAVGARREAAGEDEVRVRVGGRPARL